MVCPRPSEKTWRDLNVNKHIEFRSTIRRMRGCVRSARRSEKNRVAREREKVRKRASETETETARGGGTERETARQRDGETECGELSLIHI